MGSGAFTLVSHVQGSSWEGKRFDGYFDQGKPYLDGYKAFFVKSNAVVPGILGGQFDAEFRGRNPSEKAQLLDKTKDNLAVFEGTWVNNLMLVFNTTRKPFDDIRVRQALSMAIDRWGGSDALSKISILKYVGGVMRPGYAMSLPEAELVKLPGFAKDINKSREEAKKLLEEAGVKDLKFKLLNRNVAEPYTPGGDLLDRPVAPHRRGGRARAARDQALPGPRGGGRLRRRGRVPGRLHGRSDGPVLEVPDQEGLAQRLLGPHRHQDRRHVREAAPHHRRGRAHQDRARDGAVRAGAGLQRAAAVVAAHHRQPQEDQGLVHDAQPLSLAGPDQRSGSTNSSTATPAARECRRRLALNQRGTRCHALVSHSPPAAGDPDARRGGRRRLLPDPRHAGRRGGGEAQGRRRRGLGGDDPGRAQAAGARQAALCAVRRLHGGADAARPRQVAVDRRVRRSRRSRSGCRSRSRSPSWRPSSPS